MVQMMGPRLLLWCCGEGKPGRKDVSVDRAIPLEIASIISHFKDFVFYLTGTRSDGLYFR